MTLAIGVDLIQIKRIEAILAKPRGSRFLERVLHSSEQAHFASLSGQSRVRYVAGCWATKEAIYKTLSSIEQRKFTFNEWYRYLENGIPVIGSEAPSDNQFQLSISHDGDFLVATVLRQRLIELKDF